MIVSKIKPYFDHGLEKKLTALYETRLFNVN